MPSRPLIAVNKPTLWLAALRSVPGGIPVIFALADFLSGYGGSAYSAWVGRLYAETGPGIYCVHDCDGAYESWYQRNQEATKYADLGYRILPFAFPLAMILAILLSLSLAWLPNLSTSRLFPGLMILLCAGGVGSHLVMLLFTSALALLSGPLVVVGYVYFLVLARGIMTGRPASTAREVGSVFWPLLLSILPGWILGMVLHRLLPTFAIAYGCEVTLGAAFGVSLTLPADAPRLRSTPIHPVPIGRQTIERLVLALGAQIAISAITLFQIASRPLAPLDSRLPLLLPFILVQAPYVVLMCILLTQSGRRTSAFLIAMLGFGILETFFNPLVLLSYRQIYLDHAIGLLWPALSAVTYVATVVLAYAAIQNTGLRPKASSAILSAAGMFSYFLLIREVTPHLDRLWN